MTTYSSADTLATVVTNFANDSLTTTMVGEAAEVTSLFAKMAVEGPTVDCTTIAKESMSNGWEKLEHAQMAPPWSRCVIGYDLGGWLNFKRRELLNLADEADELEELIGDGSGIKLANDARRRATEEYGPGNVNNLAVVFAVVAIDLDKDESPSPHHLAEAGTPEGTRWVILADLYMHQQQNGTSGPHAHIQWTADEDGFETSCHFDLAPCENPVPQEVADHLEEQGELVRRTLNFMNCRNVDIVEPVRSRAVRRRLDRKGVTVSELTVYPKGKSTRSKGGEPLEGGVPLSTVRGHFAEYGERFGKGKLFGKYEGRFWIPQHARGTGDDAPDQKFTIKS